MAPRAHSAALVAYGAQWLCMQLLAGAAQHLGTVGLGWVLSQWGIGDGLAGQIGQVRVALNGIESRLSKLEEQANGLRSALAQSHYSNLVHQSLAITSSINQNMRDLRHVAVLGENDPTKARFARQTLEFIERDLLGPQQEELASRISGHAGADGLIVAFSKREKADTRFWTARTSQQVKTVFDYWQQEESALLTLRTEYWHAHRDTFRGAYIEREISHVVSLLGDQHELLKPSPPSETFADTTGDLEWWWGGIVTHQSGLDPYGHGAALGGGPGQALNPPGPFQSLAPGWRLPTAAELRHLIHGWEHKEGWISWLNDHLVKQMPLTGHSVPGVWTSDRSNTTVYCSSGTRATRVSQYYLDADGQFRLAQIYDPCSGVQGPARYGVLLVRKRTHQYWWH